MTKLVKIVARLIDNAYSSGDTTTSDADKIFWINFSRVLRVDASDIEVETPSGGIFKAKSRIEILNGPGYGSYERTYRYFSDQSPQKIAEKMNET